MEVYVKADIETCRSRDPKKLYEKLDTDGIADFTGVDSSYEVPARPEAGADTVADSEEECADALVDAILKKLP